MKPLASLALASCLLVSVARAQSPKSVRSALQARYDAFAKAFANKDKAFLENFMTDDFTTVAPGGRTLTRKQALAEFEMLSNMAHSVKWPRKVVKLRHEGDAWVATVEGKFSGLIGAKDKPQALAMNASSEDAWVKTPAGWKIRHSKVLKAQMYVNGKLTPMR